MRWLLVFFVAFPLLAHGGVITLDFQDLPVQVNGHHNFNYGGLRFSPACHASLVHHPTSDRIYVQSDHDNSNCDVYDPDTDQYLDRLPNLDFLGFNRENFYIDRFGGEFTLRGLAGAGYNGTEFWVTSSNGGSFHGIVPYFCCEPEVPYVLPYEWFALTGPEWTDITWFTLVNSMEGFGWQPHMGWTDIRYSYRVPEPPTWAIVIPGLLGLAFRRKFPKLFHPRRT